MVMALGLCGEWKCNHSHSEGYYPDLTGFSWALGHGLGNDNGQLCRVRAMVAVEHALHVLRSRNGRAIKEGDGSFPSFRSCIGASASTSWVEQTQMRRMCHART